MAGKSNFLLKMSLPSEVYAKCIKENNLNWILSTVSFIYPNRIFCALKLVWENKKINSIGRVEFHFLFLEAIGSDLIHSFLGGRAMTTRDERDPAQRLGWDGPRIIDHLGRIERPLLKLMVCSRMGRIIGHATKMQSTFQLISCISCLFRAPRLCVSLSIDTGHRWLTSKKKRTQVAYKKKEKKRTQVAIKKKKKKRTQDTGASWKSTSPPPITGPP